MIRSSSGNNVPDLPEIIAKAGIVGAGGAGFPTQGKLVGKFDTIIANGAECEPLLYNDKYLLSADAETIISGLKFVMESVGASSGIIAIKGDGAFLKEKLKNEPSIGVFELESFYPAGDEQVLIYEILKRTVPEGGLPVSVGVLVQNVETLRNISLAVSESIPVTRRFLTATGGVKTPSVVQAHIGTSVREIVDLCGGAIYPEFAVILGGPMMGKVSRDLDVPISKTTSGIIVLPPEHELIRRKTASLEVILKQAKAVCCQCSFCTDLCSRNLIGHRIYPHKIMRQISYGLDVPYGIIEGALLCSECGLCETYACTMGLSPSKVNRLIKGKLKSGGYKPAFNGPFTDNEKTSIKLSLSMREGRRIPSSRITGRLKLEKYDKKPVKFGVETDPDMVDISLSQHIGDAAYPLVSLGDKVSAGDLIGDVPEGKFGARIHASISGEVIFTDTERIVIKR